jgi:RimJ/RimL family protein N-acetyltransferase
MELKEGNVTLRPPRKEDLDRMVKLANNKKIFDNLTDSFAHPYTTDDAHKFILSATSEEPCRRFVIEIDGMFVGNIGLHPQEDIYRFNAEIGYFIGEPYWGQGIATKAVKIATAYAFEVLKVKRIYAGVFAYNPASARILEKCGYTYEGTFKSGLCKNGEFHDELRYAMVNA